MYVLVRVISWYPKKQKYNFVLKFLKFKLQILHFCKKTPLICQVSFQSPLQMTYFQFYPSFM